MDICRWGKQWSVDAVSFHTQSGCGIYAIDSTTAFVYGSFIAGVGATGDD